MTTSADELIAGTREVLEHAAERILTAAEQALGLLAAARGGGGLSVDALEALLQVIVQECAFEDIASQRLSKLSQCRLEVVDSEDPLLAGPQGRSGLDQSSADSLFAGAADARPSSS